jgi:hypothetical protein
MWKTRYCIHIQPPAADLKRQSMRWISQIPLLKVKDNEKMDINLQSWADRTVKRKVYM